MESTFRITNLRHSAVNVTSGNIIRKYLGEKRKRALKARLNKFRNALSTYLFRYDSAKLKTVLTRFGIEESDTLMVHVNFQPENGFNGTPAALADAFVDLVGDRGNLLMVSLPFRGSAYDHLKKAKPFNVKKTMSMMGLVTEMFRRKDGTHRSLHPTHPVLAFGKDAEWLVAGHEHCSYPCGKGSPFEKFHNLKGKILFFDVSFRSITFFHYVEDLLKDKLDFPVYCDELFTIPAIDADGNKTTVTTYAFNTEVRRMAEELEKEMAIRGLLTYGRVGKSPFCLTRAEDVVACFTELVDTGNSPFEMIATGNDRRPQTDE